MAPDEEAFQMINLLRRQTLELAGLQRKLVQETVRRESAEALLKKSNKNHAALLATCNRARVEKISLARRVLLDQEQEQRRISRALHDEVSQTLAGINIHLAALTLEEGGSARRFKVKITSTQRLVEKSLDIVHRFALGLRPTLLDDLGLIPALLDYMKGITRRTGLQIRFRAIPGIEKLSNAKRTALFRVVESALTNVVKHAHATWVNVTFEKVPGGLVLEIQDNGKSFEVGKVLQAKRYKRLGVVSMRERIEMQGGTFGITPAIGKGTLVRATVPTGTRKKLP